MAKPNTSSYLVSQGYAIVNDAYNETIGKNSTTVIDATNIVDCGRTLAQLDLLDGFYGKITNKIAKTVAYVLSYKADGRNIIHDAISYGAFIEKIYVDHLDASKTPSFDIALNGNTITDASGNAYNYTPYNINKTYSIDTKIFGKCTTWTLEFETDTNVLRRAFNSESQMIAFIDSIFVKAQTDIELQKEGLVTLAINTGIETAVHGGCVRNLLKEYNTKFSKSLTKANCWFDADFIKWANLEINRTIKLMAKPSTRYNPASYLNASTRDSIELEVLSFFADASKVFLESGTYHDDKVALSGTYSEIPFWQFNSEDVALASKVSVKNADVWANGSTALDFTQDGIIAIARDKDAVACIFENNYSWSMPNPRARKNAYGYDFERGYMVEPHANFIVFIVDEYDITVNKTSVEDVEFIGAWAVGNEIICVPTPSTGKTIATATYTDGSGAHNMTAMTGADSGKYKFTIPSGLTAVTFTAS